MWLWLRWFFTSPAVKAWAEVVSSFGALLEYLSEKKKKG